MSFTRKSLFTKPAWATKSSSSTAAAPIAASPAVSHAYLGATQDHISKVPGRESDDDENDDAAPIFGQRHVYEDIVAQQRKRREQHALKVKERGRNPENGKISVPTDQRESVKVGSAKRRRISKNAEDDDDDDNDEESDERTDGSDVGEASDAQTGRTVSSSAIADVKSTTKARTEGRDSATNKTVPRKSVPRTRGRRSHTIHLDSDNDNDNDSDYDYDGSKERKLGGESDDLVTSQKPSSRTSKEQPSIVESESDEEDEILRELKRNAREEARLKRLGIGAPRGPTPSTGSQTVAVDSHILEAQPVVSPDGRDGLSQTVVDGRSTSIDPRSPSNIDIVSPTSDNRAVRDGSVSDDPEVQIFIDTMIPDAKKLIVNRRVSQPLDKVREFWCQRNNLHPKIASKVFFTWNGMRLFDSTTMRGVIEMLKKTHPTKDGSDPSGGKIMIEAVTDEIFEYRKEQMERRRKEGEAEISKGLGSSTADDTKGAASPTKDDENGESHTPTERAGPVIRLLCPGVEEMNIRLRPHTSVAKIITAFRKMRDIDPNKQCWLSYDGDRLENEQTAQDIGFENDDCVDVYLR